MSNRLASLVALSRDRGATHAERALAAHHAARMIEASGGNYLDTYPAGLPDVDDFDAHVSDALGVIA